MSQDVKDFQQLEQRASLLNNLLDSPLVVESPVQSEVGCSERSLKTVGKWKVETAFILVPPSLSEWSTLLFQCSRVIILIFKCYFI